MESYFLKGEELFADDGRTFLQNPKGQLSDATTGPAKGPKQHPCLPLTLQAPLRLMDHGV